MAFRQVARATEMLHIVWPEGLSTQLTITSVTEEDAVEIGNFLLRLGHPLRPEYEPNSLAGATCYVTRLFDYHRNDLNYLLSLLCSTIVSNPEKGLIGVCLVGGGGDSGQEFGIYDIQVDPGYQNQGIGSNMIRRSLTILAEHEIPELHLWRNDDSRAQSLYQRLGFQPIGAVE